MTRGKRQGKRGAPADAEAAHSKRAKASKGKAETKPDQVPLQLTTADFAAARAAVHELGYHVSDAEYDQIVKKNEGRILEQGVLDADASTAKRIFTHYLLTEGDPF